MDGLWTLQRLPTLKSFSVPPSTCAKPFQSFLRFENAFPAVTDWSRDHSEHLWCLSPRHMNDWFLGNSVPCFGACLTRQTHLSLVAGKRCCWGTAFQEKWTWTSVEYLLWTDRPAGHWGCGGEQAARTAWWQSGPHVPGNWCVKCGQEHLTA